MERVGVVGRVHSRDRLRVKEVRVDEVVDRLLLLGPRVVVQGHILAHLSPRAVAYQHLHLLLVPSHIVT